MSWKQLQITSVASHKCRVVCAANNRKFCQFHKCIEINLQQKYQRWSGVHKEYVTSYKCIWNCKLQDWKSVQRCAKENWKLCKMAGVTRVVGQLFNIRNGQSSFDKFRRLVQELLVHMKTYLQILTGVQFVLQRLEQVVFPYKAWSMWHHVEPKERKPAIYCCAQETHNPMTKFYDYCRKFHYVWSQGESHWLWFINISNTLGVPHSHTAYYGTQCHWDRLRPTRVFNTSNHPWITLEILSQRVLVRNRVEAKERRSRKAGERV